MEKPKSLSAEKKALLEQRLRGAGRSRADASLIRKREISAEVQLSFAQRQVWVIDQMTPGNPAYNLPVGYRIKGDLNVRALEESFNSILARHEALRTTFSALNGDPMQIVHPECKISIVTSRLDHLDEEAREIQLHRLASAEAVRPFDLSRLPLIRVSLFVLTKFEHVLVINIHHIVSDGMSIGPLMNELDEFYRRFTGLGESSLPDLPIQYGDFAEYQRKAMSSETAFAGPLKFWTDKFHAAPPMLELPCDKPRPALQSFEGSNLFFSIPSALTQGLKALGSAENCTLFVTLLAAFQVLLKRYAGAEDVVVGTPVANRTTQEVAPLIGNFLNMAALRCDISGDPAFVELLRRSKDTTLDAFSNGDLPFDELVKHLRVERDLSRNPIFQVMLQISSSTALNLGNLDIRGFHFDLGFAQFDLSLHLYEEEGGYVGRFEYCTDLFDRETVQRLALNFEQLLHAIVKDPLQKISSLPILSAAEANKLFREWNNTRTNYPADMALHQLFEEQASRSAHRIAVRHGVEEISYFDLNVRANRIARTLRDRGAGRGQRVGLCLERGVDMLAAVLGVLKAGAAYVPLDPSFPEERLRFMAEDAQVAHLVSTSALAHLGGVPRERQLLLDSEAEILAEANSLDLPDDKNSAHGEDPAYVIYTSGSTGKPKGVVVPHRAVVNFLSSMKHEPGLNADDVLVAVTTLSFDIAVLELQLPLTLGATVVIAGRDETIDGHALRNLLDSTGATAMQATPSTWRLLLDAGWSIPPRFKALVGGESLPVDLANKLIGPSSELWNMYGPTETTVWSTCARITNTADGITIGKPIANTTVWILDAQRAVCPIGVAGELAIGGDGVTLGYWNRSDLTRERFIPDPFGASPGSTLYLTGDRARWRADGTLEHLGRLDFQVKLRGYRIELGEIETGIARHPAIRQVVVIAREDTPGDQRLVAYLVADNPPSDLVDQLRDLIRVSMPEYMVPAHFFSLEALPLTNNGKIDRKALPEPKSYRNLKEGFIAPKTDVELKVAGILQKILRLDKVGINDDFFRLGGNSLLATQVVARIRHNLLVEFPLRDFFAAPTIANLASRIEHLKSEPMQGVPPMERSSETGPAELSLSQQGLWFLDKLDTAGAAYVIAEALEIRGSLDLAILQKSLFALVERHESLRAVFTESGGSPLQIISESPQDVLSIIDLSGEIAPKLRLPQLLKEDAARTFDLLRGPLFRASLFRLSPDTHVLLLAAHHIISDGWSMGVLSRDLGKLYGRFSRGDETLPALSFRYRDFARWQRDRLQGESLGKLLAHWRSRLSGAPHTLELHTDRPRPAAQSHRGAIHSFVLPSELADRVREIALREGATLFMTLLAGFTLLLSRYSGQKDLLVGTPTANRGRTEIEDLVGCFVNIIVLRADLSGDLTVSQHLARTKIECLDAFGQPDLPFDRLVEELKPARDLSRNPLFQIMFALHNAPSRPDLPGLTLESFDLEFTAAQVDIALHVWDTADGLKCLLSYATDLYDESTIARMASHWQSLLEGMVDSPISKLSELTLLPESERRMLITDWNDTRVEYRADALLHESFEMQTSQAPQRTAVRFKALEWSYADLNSRANRIAQVLRARGAGRNHRIGICVERGLDMIAGVLGVLKSGAAYVPLDPLFPEERVRFMADDAGVSLLLSSTSLVNRFGFDLPRERQLLLDADAEIIDGASDSALPADPNRALPEDPAYVIYTSGSTGKPKGVAVPHRAVVNFLASMARTPGLTSDDVLVAVTTLSFDIAVLELQLPLTMGATVAMASREESIDGQLLKDLIERQRATVLQATPVTWRLLLEAGWIPQVPFKVLIGGEALPKDLADSLIGLGVELWNMYGPTETTVWSTCGRVTDTSQGISIGKPIDNTVIRILDSGGNLCPIGVAGEMYIGGDGVAIGYWKRPDLTSERFIPDSFSEDPNTRMYRTGDLARWRSDGNLEHLGRLDSQVKLRGYRIELGEIETGIAGHPAVREVVVVAREDSPGDKRLVAYIVTQNQPTDLVDQLRTLIRVSMPEYMVPAHFVSIDALPLTPNGKIDRKALPAPQFNGDAMDSREYAAPRNDLEISLTAAWEKVLAVPRVGITENFFELGGNSFSVVKLIFEMKQATGIEIDLGDVFTFPTIERLVGQFSPDAKKEMSVVVPLQASGEGVPLFCICGINIYRQFAQSLGNDQPVFGVYVAEEQAIVKQLAEGLRPEISIERLVDAYDRAIARFRPHGPYRLGGISFGGVLAMGLASKLRERGEQVEFVLLLDTMLPRGKRRNWLKWFGRNAVDLMTGRSWSKVRRRLFRSPTRAVRQAIADASKRAGPVDDAYAARLGAEFFKASKQWEDRDTVCDFPVVLFRATDHSEWGSDVEFDEDYGWRPYVGENLSIVHVDGNHLGIIESPNVELLGPRARRIIDEAGKRGIRK